jgi:hypothetical protein
MMLRPWHKADIGIQWVTGTDVAIESYNHFIKGIWSIVKKLKI